MTGARYVLKDGQGTLHPNDAATEANKQPAFTGKLLINGVLYRLAGWQYATSKGRHWLSLKAELPRPQDAAAAPGEAQAPKPQAPAQTDFDDDIPF